GIEAARLEAVARPGQVLCTALFHDLFSEHYPQLFSTNPLPYATKDRELLAYEVKPIGLDHLKEFFSAYVFGDAPFSRRPAIGARKILIVDDDASARSVFSDYCALKIPDCEV